MKCKICGYSTTKLANMGAHYRKKHPSKMKKQRTKNLKISNDSNLDKLLLEYLEKRLHNRGR